MGSVLKKQTSASQFSLDGVLRNVTAAGRRQNRVNERGHSFTLKNQDSHSRNFPVILCLVGLHFHPEPNSETIDGVPTGRCALPFGCLRTRSFKLMGFLCLPLALSPLALSCASRTWRD